MVQDVGERRSKQACDRRLDPVISGEGSHVSGRQGRRPPRPSSSSALGPDATNKQAPVFFPRGSRHRQEGECDLGISCLFEGPRKGV
jgi:hypothetical protein